jgi:EamA-like transporter family
MVFLDAEAERDQAMTYIISVAYMCALFLSSYSTHVINCCQVLATDSAPVARSEGCSGTASTPGHFWVGLVLRIAGSPHRHPRFIGLSGGYFSLQYLSLSDATVLTFLAPILTAFSGAVFLKETLSLKDMCAGCMSSQVISTIFEIHRVLVCSFFGVILIARPPSLFGGPKGELSEVVMPWQRMLSVMLGVPHPLPRSFLLCHFIVLHSSVSWESLVPVSHLSATWIQHLSPFS